MKIKRFPIANDGFEIECTKWYAEEKQMPKLAIQLAHGMAEHIDRYDAFAKFLVSKGYTVYGYNHRGHGRNSLNDGSMGFFAEENGWSKVVDDMKLVNDEIHKECGKVPVILFGHSMGSFLSRTYISKYGESIEGVILSGTGSTTNTLANLGKFLAKMEMIFRGKKHKSNLLNAISFKSYNDNFKPKRTDFDWLSRDEDEVDKYINDELCGNVFTSNFFYDLLCGVKGLNDMNNIKNIPKKLKVLLVSGDKDPVGANSKGVQKVYDMYRETGIESVILKLYKDARHEVLNEINKQEVYDDIANWLEKVLYEIPKYDSNNA